MRLDNSPHVNNTALQRSHSDAWHRIGAVPTIPACIPRAELLDGFIADPLNFLRQARITHGDLFVLREPGAIFSRADDGVGVVAVFGLDYQRAVLTDPDSFGMPVSAALRLNLPPNLANLNRGLHSLTGAQHTAHRRSLSTLLNECAEHQQPAITAAVNSFIRRWRESGRVHLLNEMRELALSICRHLLFGARAGEQAGLAARMRTYFDLRREVSAPASAQGSIALEELTTLGNHVDDELRGYIQACRATGGVPDGIVARLARLESFGTLLSEDEVIGHANVLFISSTEPVAVTLTWIFLVLSQLPDLRRALREAGTGTSHDVVPALRGGLPLLDSVIDETLRVLPPNAFMVRTTTRPVVVGDIELPPKCEIVLCPFISHRDPEYFPQPDRFTPERWRGSAPSPFVYFPFGAGGHFCVGRALALSAIRAAVSRILAQYDLVLAGEQEVDWRLHIIFMPSSDPLFSIQPVAGACPADAGRLRGPVAAMLQLDIS
jgi:cytochrome P450